jgi:hypothetical protein
MAGSKEYKALNDSEEGHAKKTNDTIADDLPF